MQCITGLRTELSMQVPVLVLVLVLVTSTSCCSKLQQHCTIGVEAAGQHAPPEVVKAAARAPAPAPAPVASIARLEIDTY